MGKLFCLIGKSGSGKDTLFKMLIEDKDLAIRPVISYTTRPIRFGETNGVEYFFIDNECLLQFERADKVIEKRVYKTVLGLWTYCTIDDGQIELSKDNYLVISTLEAYSQFKDYFGSENVVPIYIEVEDSTRLERAIKREKLQQQPNYEELCRRFLADSLDFSQENLRNYQIYEVYENNNLESCYQAIKEDIITCPSRNH